MSASVYAPLADERMAVHGSDTIFARFGELVSQHPDRVALIDGEDLHTYRDLARLASSCARLLRERLTLASGQILLAWLDNCPEFAASFLATTEIGAIFLPLNTSWRPPELRWFLDRLPVAGVVTRRSLGAPWEDLSDRIRPDRVLALDDPALPWPETVRIEASSRAPAEQIRPDQPALYLASSGSTGVPKTVSRSHRNVLEGAAGTASALGVTAGLRFAGVIPFHHGNGFDNSLALPLLSGGTVVLQSGFVPSRFSADMLRHQIQVLIGSPAIFDLLVRFRVDLGWLAGLRVCASSGGPVAEETAREIHERCGVTIRQVYGSSETGVIAVSPPEGGPSLVPVSTASLRIVDGDSRQLPPGQKGEIEASGPTVVSGYVEDPEMTAAAFHDGHFRTGDLGRLDADGRLTLLGRLRPQINLSGTKVDPAEVETVILSLPGVSACRVLGACGPRGGQIVRAVIAVDAGTTLDRTDVIEHCRKRLAEYKIPRIVEFVEALPADLTGKRVVSWKGAQT